VHRPTAFAVDFLPPCDRDQARRLHEGLDAIDAESTIDGVASALASLLR
jgi:hypothetical protein